MKQLNLEKKVIAIFLILCIAAAVSLSALFIVNHVEHDCTGEDCGVCQEISACLRCVVLQKMWAVQQNCLQELLF